MARGGKVVDGKGEMERAQCHAANIHPRHPAVTTMSGMTNMRRPPIAAPERILLPILLGAAAATGFAPLDLLPAMLLAFAWWLRLVHDAPTLRAALLTGWLFGVGHFTINDNWIQHAFDYQDKMPPVLGYFAAVGLALYLAVYPMLAAGFAWRLASPRAAGDGRTRPGAPFVLVAGAGWIATEWLRASMFTGYAWDPLGVAWLTLPDVAGAARWIGTYALSGVMVVSAGAILLLLHRRWALAALLACALPVLALAGGGRSPIASAAPDAPRVRVVQPNIDQVVHVTPQRVAETMRRLVALSGTPGPAPRLVVWPVGAVDPFLEDGYPPSWYWRGSPYLARMTIAGVLGPRDRALVGGNALEFDGRGELTGARNSVFVVGSDGRLGGRYDKAHLVPYGEYLPMRPLLEPLGLSRLVAGDVDFLDGPGPRTLAVPGFGPVGMQICYEIIFSGRVVDRRARPALIFNPSNDAWFGAWGPPQHLAQARMRAIEEGLPVIRSTPNGISAVIAADGRILAQVPRHRAGAVEVAMPPALAPTLFSRVGNAMAAIVAALLLVLAIVLRRR
jgi:apolipoprotein N-acyltransferase